MYEDVETGLYYNRFRYYNPKSGLYLSQDPIGLLGGIALYAFVHNANSWVDIFGLHGTGGAYLFELENGKRYVGKGEAPRMEQSITQRTAQAKSPVSVKSHISTGGDNELGKMVEHKIMKDEGFVKGSVPENYLNSHLSGQTAWDSNPHLQQKATDLANQLKADFDAKKAAILCH
ncbi:RHS repeat-associated core domain-containing protein [Flavobacterium pectinovorum]|uniref:RHS repeat-associated core domain-containing protein n=1 Tax=Flavobacterium pectinovorum TaxID=29533 RepID=A0AB36NYG7_9FLAO|nr:RHS repeat-associated core domain-containing protein [Flavobacterium pectinovorum]OXB03267.1 hypothetical protein B0A72_15105 [Flavobacterium pectinovorum]SHL21779.1 RHS repeat-associated core domain-containing protein [Flavobacterium pectinovorum]